MYSIHSALLGLAALLLGIQCFSAYSRSYRTDEEEEAHRASHHFSILPISLIAQNLFYTPKARQRRLVSIWPFHPPDSNPAPVHTRVNMIGHGDTLPVGLPTTSVIWIDGCSIFSPCTLNTILHQH